MFRRSCVMRCAGSTGSAVGVSSSPGILSFAVAFVPGCDRSWMDWNTWSRKGAGTYGRGFPADVSQ
jgi:hypothetical protein